MSGLSSAVTFCPTAPPTPLTLADPDSVLDPPPRKQKPPLTVASPPPRGGRPGLAGRGAWWLPQGRPPRRSWRLCAADALPAGQPPSRSARARCGGHCHSSPGAAGAPQERGSRGSRFLPRCCPPGSVQAPRHAPVPSRGSKIPSLPTAAPWT